jgi:hypothetical protein
MQAQHAEAHSVSQQLVGVQAQHAALTEEYRAVTDDLAVLVRENQVRSAAWTTRRRGCPAGCHGCMGLCTRRPQEAAAAQECDHLSMGPPLVLPVIPCRAHAPCRASAIS